eukprot:SAG22_NODE_2827_length_2174_cov_2.477108_3_plen_54_part_01
MYACKGQPAVSTDMIELTCIQLYFTALHVQRWTVWTLQLGDDGAGYQHAGGGCA